MTLLTVMMILTTTAPPAQWHWPLSPVPGIVRGFSPPALPWGPGHRGVDLAARPGQPVYAAGAGRISYAGRLAGRGVIAVTHGALRTTYLPVRPTVRTGRQVASGARIGVVENGPFHCSSACLHWGLRRGAVYLDPLSLVGHRVRLLPHWRPPERPAPVSRPAPAERPHQMELRDAATAGGGALTGMLLAFALLFVWRQGRPRRRTALRQPPDVIDLAQERRLRRTP
ncbi:murein hydrolase activator EnvC family protein [Spirillospora sp. NBC_01491]|uniref:murein hydrolase activator EnvC family protein n=1 Tax=Spirillospora sp. NBC_01491 TaxID=2976007 RepID=UPI002E33CF13|nr:M23 family metallopeptidase [Spirillospora sp. NBC_01491]